MKRVLLGCLLCGVGCFAYGAEDALLRQTKHAFFTMQAIGQQLTVYHNRHRHFPKQVPDTDFALSMLGFKPPLSKNWDYFYQCEDGSCTIMAYRIKKLSSSPKAKKQTLVLRRVLTRGKTLSPAIAEIRGIATFIKGTNGFVWETTSPADEELCDQLDGEKNTKLDCIIHYTRATR